MARKTRRLSNGLLVPYAYGQGWVVSPNVPKVIGEPFTTYGAAKVIAQAFGLGMARSLADGTIMLDYLAERIREHRAHCHGPLVTPTGQCACIVRAPRLDITASRRAGYAVTHGHGYGGR